MNDNNRASDIIKKAKEDFDSGKISRRDFNSILMTFGAIAGYTFYNSFANAWTGTRIKKSSAGSGSTPQQVDIGDNVANSLMLDSGSNQYLSRTFGSPTDAKKWTLSGWIKLGAPTVAAYLAGIYNGPVDYIRIHFNPAGTFEIVDYSGGAANIYFISNSVYRDYSSWYHVVLKVDTAQAVNTDRITIWINGVELTSFSTATYPAQNYIPRWNASSISHRIGGFTTMMDGQLSNVHFVDGQALSASSFGRTSAQTGQWVPVNYNGAYGANGFKLDFSNGAALGQDVSAVSNHWALNGGITSANQCFDTPTNNFCTLNPLQTGSYSTLSKGNLKTAGNTAANSAVSVGTIGCSTGKWYWEIKNLVCSSETIGVATKAVLDHANLINGESNFPPAYGIGARYNGATYGIAGELQAVAGFSWINTDVIGIAVDADNGAVYFSKNGTWLNSGVPTSGALKTGAFGKYTPDSTRLVTPFCGSYNSGVAEANFGQRAFVYTPPAGFKALSTNNLPTPSIVNSRPHFDIALYTGNASARSISTDGNGNNLQIAPDLVWAKARTGPANNHVLFDSVRGVGNYLMSSGIAAENSNGTMLTSFNSNGFSVGTDSTTAINGSALAHVAWMWKAASATLANNTGTIASQVRANSTAGFSIVTWIGNGVASTIGHGMTVAPKMILVKTRSGSAIMPWCVGHSGLNGGVNPWSYYLHLSDTNPQAGAISVWNNTAPTSSVFSVGDDQALNYSAAYTYIAYCFAEIAGFSKIGSYICNASADGPFVYCGFKPKWVMIKYITAGTSDWMIYDSSRSSTNAVANSLRANLSNAEATRADLDFLANGFKIRSAVATTDSINFTSGGGTFIFYAIAEAPQKYATAR